MHINDLDKAERRLRAAIDAGDYGSITAAAAVVDAIEHQQKSSNAAKPAATLHQAALWFAEQGLRVFPLTPGTKIPFKGSAGCKDATTNPDVINGWWTDTPDANIGIATGHLVDVVDIDGLKGQTSRAHHWGMFEQLDVIAKVSTPRPGGAHLYVPASGRGNKAGLVPGIDYRGTGGYVVAPPSVIADGPHPGRYEFTSAPTLPPAMAVAA